VTDLSQTDWRDITYLQRGNPRQQQAYRALRHLRVFEILRDYSPVLAGTFPLDISLPGSDLDILCEAYDLVGFRQRVAAAFRDYADFQIKEKIIKGIWSLVASFQAGDFRIEIFGQPRPVEEQHAFRHMLVEARLLEIGVPDARDEIRRLKGKGLKTEPAFARYFGLDGDAYEVLLELSFLTLEELYTVLNKGDQEDGDDSINPSLI
jgi:hypothetical protein